MRADTNSRTTYEAKQKLLALLGYIIVVGLFSTALDKA